MNIVEGTMPSVFINLPQIGGLGGACVGSTLSVPLGSLKNQPLPDPKVHAPSPPPKGQQCLQRNLVGVKVLRCTCTTDGVPWGQEWRLGRESYREEIQILPRNSSAVS